jgi:hypothetical protein
MFYLWDVRLISSFQTKLYLEPRRVWSHLHPHPVLLSWSCLYLLIFCASIILYVQQPQYSIRSLYTQSVSKTLKDQGVEKDRAATWVSPLYWTLHISPWASILASRRFHRLAYAACTPNYTKYCQRRSHCHWRLHCSLIFSLFLTFSHTVPWNQSACIIRLTAMNSRVLMMLLGKWLHASPTISHYGSSLMGMSCYAPNMGRDWFIYASGMRLNG